ncbi:MULTISPECIES: LysR family transcriptional regulator [unclassified Streptomyces]|uniref:LysR family transcriptional regulator n=1 Tax=unclassified Streptomyces TaxID=2593676 RepID=UPI00225A3626|nr:MULTISPECIES: LysR family transcriptional regulator [unclassified Streptomyces]MCX5328288.1 LysR family transcriptional regulator [Streptomyces sp. NBC_00140]MCX5357699.1 LysR family transcriptional regulator [Streptomyces sp. NBC_00124]
MDTLETRELRYFLAVAEELHFGRAAERLGMAQPPLSRAIQQLERRLGVCLLERNRRGVSLTGAGEVLLHEGRAALDATTAAARRTRRAGGVGSPSGTRNRLVLAVKAAASHELLLKLLDAYAAEPDAVEVEVLPSGTCEQEEMLRDGRADVALMHAPYNSLAGFDSEELLSEGQIAVLPAGHPLAGRRTLSLADVSDLPDLPLARWARHGTYPPGPGPEVRDQTQLAQLIALGRTMAVFPDSSRAWLWAEHAAVPLTDAPPVVTHIAWPAHSRSVALAGLIRTATEL